MSCPATSSGLKSSSGVILAMPGTLRGVIAGADGTNAATIIIYDNATTNAGTVLCKIVVDAGATHESVILEAGISANAGLYCALSGTGAEAVVLFDAG